VLTSKNAKTIAAAAPPPPHCLILIRLLRHWLNQQSLVAQGKSHSTARKMMPRTPPQCSKEAPPGKESKDNSREGMSPDIVIVI
jgi:hypothetical protein